VVELSRLLALALQSRRLVETGAMAAVDRSRWPEVCEERVSRGLKNIIRMVHRGSL
jgi:hypothetical protein